MNILNQPPPFGLVNNFLGVEQLIDLLKYVESKQPFFETSKIIYENGSRIDLSERISQVLRKIDEYQVLFESKLMKLMSFIFERIKCKVFNPHKFEIQLVAHRDGAFFKPHIDTELNKSAKSRRVISCVYYFHTMPKAFSGGELRLYSLSNGKQVNFIDIEPLCDTLIFFPSWFPHEVLPVICPNKSFMDSRFAINIWIHESFPS